VPFGAHQIAGFRRSQARFRDQTRSQQLILKPGYTPAEQYRNNGVPGPWTDVYALAATLYRCLTGRVPPEAMERLIQDEIRPPAAFGVQIQPRAEEALMHALAVRAKDRYQTMEAFQRDIMVAPPPPPVPPVPPACDAVLFQFRVWWCVGAVAISLGRVLRGRIDQLLRVPQAASPGSGASGQFIGARVVLFLLLTVLGILVTAFHPIGILLLLANLFVGGVAIDWLWNSLNADLPSIPNSPVARLRCISGEHGGSILEVGSEPIFIGRNAAAANLVFSAKEISGLHAKIWVDPSDARLWLEDLASLNGTYVIRSGQESAARATRLQGSDTLSRGDVFWLSGKNIAAFEVEEILRTIRTARV